MARKRLLKSNAELGLLAALRSRKQPESHYIELGIGDDCALLRIKRGENVAITTDLSLENVHFRRELHPAESVGHRCLARGLSDLAAMGARPVAAFLSLAVPSELTIKERGRGSWVERFFDGLMALAERFDLPLAGGDTAESPGAGSSGLVAADIVLVGGVPRGRALLRSGARAGDLIYVTGSLGGAAAELLALQQNPLRFKGMRRDSGIHPHLYPQPRIAAGLKLRSKQLSTAAIDLSDGLSTDLYHLCEESGLSAEVDAAAIPIHPMARLAQAAGWAPSALELALHGGEDYELLFTAGPKTEIGKKIGDVPVVKIGRMLTPNPDGELLLMRESGRTVSLHRGGWEHFSRKQS